ncbi:MAG: zinc carboxypeptidase [Flavobacteriaceae bacterium]|nr:zinc carboxypeptidase [Flavobacteriaceae bacterium]
MQSINLDKFEKWYAANFESKLSGLRILLDDIEPLIQNLNNNFLVKKEGFSENGLLIHSISIGNGQKRVLIWSQMHGNESTGTKVLFDLFNFFENSGELSAIREQVLSNCTLIFIPMLNPDGAITYTRENAKGIDLNRDAVDRKAIESQFLRDILDKFKPHFCFNLHDQRTIFNVEGTKNPATISFLAPSEDERRTITKGRTKTMAVIVAMNNLLRQAIPNHIGRYTDEFYPTATGDTFQKLGHNTILIEAGHFSNDYQREITRKYNFFALLQGLYYIAINDVYDDFKDYFNIPNNEKKFFDIIYRNAMIFEDSEEKIVDVGMLFKYRVSANGALEIYESVEKTGDLKDYLAHKEINLNKKLYKP